MRPLLCYLHSGPRPGTAGGPRFSGRGSRFRAGKLKIGAYAAKAAFEFALLDAPMRVGAGPKARTALKMGADPPARGVRIPALQERPCMKSVFLIEYYRGNDIEGKGERNEPEAVYRAEK